VYQAEMEKIAEVLVDDANGAWRGATQSREHALGQSIVGPGIRAFKKATNLQEFTAAMDFGVRGENLLEQ
jgi:hypothetical protein